MVPLGLVGSLTRFGINIGGFPVSLAWSLRIFLFSRLLLSLLVSKAPERFLSPVPNKVFSLLIMGSIISMLIHRTWTVYGLRIIVNWITLLLISGNIIVFFRRDELLKLWKFSVSSILFVSIGVVFQLIKAKSYHLMPVLDYRGEGFFSTPGYMGYYSTTIWALLLPLLLLHKRNVGLMLLTLANFALIYMSLMRGPWIVAIASFIVIAYTLYPKALIASPIMVGIIASIPYTKLRFKEFYEIGFDLSNPSFLSGRIGAWQILFEASKERILDGYGFGSYYQLSNNLFGYYLHAHCDPLLILLSLGVIGLFVYLLFYLISLRYILKNTLEVNSALCRILRASGLGILIVLCAGLWDNIIGNFDILSKFFIVISGVEVLKRSRRRQL